MGVGVGGEVDEEECRGRKILRMRVEVAKRRGGVRGEGGGKGDPNNWSRMCQKADLSDEIRGDC